MKLYAELVNGTRSEIKVSGEIEDQLRHIRGDAGGEAPRWIAGADGSWIQTSHVVRFFTAEDTPAFA